MDVDKHVQILIHTHTHKSAVCVGPNSSFDVLFPSLQTSVNHRIVSTSICLPEFAGLCSSRLPVLFLAALSSRARVCSVYSISCTVWFSVG